jgi:phospholipid/cholesterol/gamma-HCH transport system substrate-binding protein
METRAPYALIGLFVLAVIVAVFGFVYWLHNTGGLAERAYYRVRFQHSVSGMLVGAAVLFNGIRVGEVTDLKLDPDNPQRITATVGVAIDTPVRADTKAGIDFQGLTGVAVVTLNGGDPKAPKLAATGREPPIIEADPMAWQTMTQAARTVLQRFDALLSDNADAVKSAIANINKFSDALARNSDRVDGILKGLERMTGGGPQPAPPAIYDLTAPRAFPPRDKISDAQLTVAEPTTLLMLDTQKILVRPGVPESPTFADAKWADNLPKLIQAKVIQSLENSRYFKAVTRHAEDLNAEYRLMMELRTFQISTEPETAADIEFSAKIVGENGQIQDSRVFRATVPTKVTDAAAAAAALDQAFGKVASELVTWLAEAI